MKRKVGTLVDRVLHRIAPRAQRVDLGTELLVALVGRAQVREDLPNDDEREENPDRSGVGHGARRERTHPRWSRYRRRRRRHTRSLNGRITNEPAVRPSANAWVRSVSHH
jgi:hypothetical protein